MHIELERQDDTFNFRAVNEDGNVVDIDGSPEIGGRNKGVRPMQLLLMGLGGCSGIDVVSILKKQKQEITGMKIGIDGERQAGKVPSLFERIDVHFSLEGELDPKKVKRAVSLSMDKYCSVTRTLEKTAQIDYQITLNGKPLN